MENMLKKSIDRFEGEQKKNEKVGGSESIAEEKRTTLSLSLTVSDKKTLKILAAKREMTIAAIIHEWIQEHAEVNK